VKIVANFDEISQSMDEIKLLPVSENGQPPCWNSISGLDFNLRIGLVIGRSFCICLPNFVVIGRSAADLYRFSRRRPQSRQSTSGFRFSDGIC